MQESLEYIKAALAKISKRNVNMLEEGGGQEKLNHSFEDVYGIISSNTDSRYVSSLREGFKKKVTAKQSNSAQKFESSYI